MLQEKRKEREKARRIRMQELEKKQREVSTDNGAHLCNERFITCPALGF